MRSPGSLLACAAFYRGCYVVAATPEIYVTDKSRALPFNCGPVNFATDVDAARLVESVYNTTAVVEGVELADLYRYAVIYMRGGAYVDVDVTCIQRPHQWLAEYDISYTPDLLIGVEFYSALQFCQWAFMGTPRSHVLRHVIRYIADRRLNAYAPLSDPVQRTGPVAWTAALLDYMKRYCGYLTPPAVADDGATHVRCSNARIAIVPYRAFSTPGYNPTNARTWPHVLVRHRFRGSWKNAA